MSLTSAQLTTLRTNLLAETDSTFVGYRNAGDLGGIHSWYNSNHPTFIVWKTNVPLYEIGDAINGSELAGLSTLNTTRLQAILMLSPNGYNPSKGDRRSFFDDIFSGAGGTNTRPALLALWKRAAKRGEQLFATGTGSDASPGTIVVEGTISFDDITKAFYNTF